MNKRDQVEFDPCANERMVWGGGGGGGVEEHNRPSVGQESLPCASLFLDPCTDFPCKRGKTCKLDADSKPGCACQQASECPPSVNDFDRVSTAGDAVAASPPLSVTLSFLPQVCGTDNTTYDSSCHLFATKCNLEGTKRGHRLHLDYTGPCKRERQPLRRVKVPAKHSRVSPSVSHSPVRGRRAGPVPPADARLAEKRAAAALRTRLCRVRLPHRQAAF